MKIFVLHYSKLTERKQFILEQFDKHNITDYEFIEKYDKNEIEENDEKKFSQNFSKSMMSLVLKHFYAYKAIMDNYEHALIFEDDVVLSENFTELFNIYIQQLPNDADMLFIGNGCNLHIESNRIIPGIYIYEKCLHPTPWGGNGATRCTDSYIVSKKCARQLCAYIDAMPYKIDKYIDWWLNRAAQDIQLKIFWAEPTIVSQGSELGLFKNSY